MKLAGQYLNSGRFGLISMTASAVVFHGISCWAKTPQRYVALPPPVNPPVNVVAEPNWRALLSGAGERALFGGNRFATGIPLGPGTRPLYGGVDGNFIVNNKANDTFSPPTNARFTQSETTVAVFGNNVVVGYNDDAGPTSFSGYSFSSDGGQTFTQGSSLVSAGGGRSGDPVLVVDSGGVFYYAQLDSGTVAGLGQSGISIGISTDSGATFATGTFFGAGNACDFLDKEQIAVLQSSSALGGPRIVITYTRFVNSTSGCGTTSSQIEAVVVNPSTGAVIQGPVVIESGTAPSGTIPRVDANGRIFVSWEKRASPQQIRIARSDDNGATYTGLGGVVTVSGLTPVGTLSAAGACDPGTSITRFLINGGIRMNDFPTMDIDTTGGIGNNNIYIAWNDGRNGDGDILFSRSTDNGATWSAPIRANDDAVGNGRDQFFPWITVDPTGWINMVFYDRRNDANNALIDLFHTECVNRGLNFNTNLRVTDTSFPPIVNVDQGIASCYMGDYNGAASDARHIYTAWGDNRNGDPDVFFAVLHNTQRIRVNTDPDFGNVCLGTVGTRILEVFNTGDLNLKVTNVSRIAGSAGFTVDPNPVLPVTIRPGEHVDFTIRYTPPASGSESATIRVASSDATQPNLDIVYTANTPTGKIQITGSTDFGTVCAGAITEKTLAVCNASACDLNVLSADLGTCTGFTLVNNPFPTVVAPGTCADLTIRVTPTACGLQSCMLTIISDDPDNPTKTFMVTADVPCATIGVSPDLGFPPEVIQFAGLCATLLPFPIANEGQCNLTVTDVSISGTDAGDFGLFALPPVPIILEPGHLVGEGDFSVLFAPTVIARERSATLNVTYISDPVSGATTTITRNLCGEGVLTGARVLVMHAGVPVPFVEKIHLQRINANRQNLELDTQDVALNLDLVTVIPTPPCEPFQYHREYGTVSNPIQLLPGVYEVTVQAIINGKRKNMSVGFDLTTCDFNPTVVVNFP